MARLGKTWEDKDTRYRLLGVVAELEGGCNEENEGMWGWWCGSWEGSCSHHVLT